MSRKSDKQQVIQCIALKNYYSRRLENLALTEFQYDNMPDTCDADYLERCFLYKTKASIYRPKELDMLLSTGWLSRGNFNAYGYPTDIVGVDFNGRNIETDEWVIAWDNKERDNTYANIQLYAQQLAEIHQTIRANLFQQRHPLMPAIDKSELLSYQTIYNEIDDFTPFIPVKKGFDTENLNPLDLRIPYIGNELFDTLDRAWGKALNMLGITAETDKKERLISQEISLNRQEDILSLGTRYYTRKKMCEEVNEKFGTNIQVKLAVNDTNLIAREDDMFMQRAQGEE